MAYSRNAKKNINNALVLLVFSLIAQSAPAKAPPDQTARLDRDLTPLGAERAGSEGGEVPPWDGGIKQPPANYNPDKWHADPFDADVPRFIINAGNAQDYSDKLTEGHKALLQKYPSDYILKVYPSRRSASYPDHVYAALKQNAAKAELMPRGTGVKGSLITSPFPIPNQGVEIIWNHILRYRGEEAAFRSSFAATLPDGSYTPVTTDYEYFFVYAQQHNRPEDIDNKIFYLKTEVVAPAKLAGTMNLVHETLDQIRSPRQSWGYQAGERRVRRSPNLAYDGEAPNSEGVRTTDQIDMYNGAPDQYEWTLIAKKIIYVPYNAYPLHSSNLRMNDIVRPGHINQEHARYEAHRVWVVEGVLREGLGHIYHKRRMYFDEDSWQLLVAEDYDDKGELWRVSEAHVVNYYEVKAPWTTLEVIYDLKSGRYFVDGLDNEERPRDFAPGLRDSDFSTSAVRRAARR
ncbi:protein of unknown function (DUF1329) [Hahella chejuensis KCTC 2396]|uniref:Outer membrane lipoprotein-sorting protein n=1 Tax=Hahella chejuensis (strain KCTC 2396) TaxID=349521 RepID=Q2SKC9_HAHCH|nr:DUF1329 domain-containing protein [Hahella chejuensis]ABC28895.1 protein of unknown function (DUF1329) [Hahella chejuensis KCTC 2396]